MLQIKAEVAHALVHHQDRRQMFLLKQRLQHEAQSCLSFSNIRNNVRDAHDATFKRHRTQVQ